MSEDNGSWVPEAGDILKGTVVDIRTQDGGYGPYPLLVIDTGEEQKALHAFHSILRGELAKRRPKVGDEITVAYIGKVPSKAGREYHSYRVSGGTASGAGYDWNQDLPAEAQVEPDIPVEAPTPVPVADTSDVPF